ncbi:ML domain-containing protein [Streptomyces sp. NBC_00091]|uniref:ML domain-containing protein n=1 Tax=Streptomyces sp. NBC_00091 TaxID=2975648 RepID=UPI002251CA16|nr:ML domain-containing protein [Streptomyces sp. NBC_00091]MCX5376219.1 ML domain-containing protein [Streptomyces sp. NBC_00091]
MTKWMYEDVGMPEDVFQVKSVSVTPDPLVRGETAVFTLNGRVVTAIEDGAYVDVVVKLGLIKLLTKRLDLLDELRRGDLKLACDTSDGNSPIPAGDTNFTLTFDFPKEAPQAKFSCEISAFTADDEDLASLRIHLDLMGG